MASVAPVLVASVAPVLVGLVVHRSWLTCRALLVPGSKKDIGSRPLFFFHLL